MKWSYSAGRTFQACQRQWYYKNIFGIGQAKKDPERRRMYLLGKQDSIAAWRGRIVDELITDKVVTPFNEGDDIPDLKTMIGYAEERFQQQLAFARSNIEVTPELDVKAAGQAFALIREVASLSTDDIEHAWLEIKQALRTFYRSDEAKAIIKSADYLVSQKALQFQLLDGVTVVGFPDLIAFRDEHPPTIVDWKVHAQGTHDAWIQLAIYAICLERCKPHFDWERYFDDVERSRENVRLVEVQLLTDVVREHALDAEHFERAEEFMQTSAYEMACLIDGRKSTDLALEEFDVARFPEACDSCSYKSHCWEVRNAA